MRQYRISRDCMIDMIVEASQLNDFSYEIFEIDNWVTKAEETLHELFWFDQFTAQHILLASEKIRKTIEKNYFSEPDSQNFEQQITH